MCRELLFRHRLKFFRSFDWQRVAHNVCRFTRFFFRLTICPVLLRATKNNVLETFDTKVDSKLHHAQPRDSTHIEILETFAFDVLSSGANLCWLGAK